MLAISPCIPGKDEVCQLYPHVYLAKMKYVGYIPLYTWRQRWSMLAISPCIPGKGGVCQLYLPIGNRTTYSKISNKNILYKKIFNRYTDKQIHIYTTSLRTHRCPRCSEYSRRTFSFVVNYNFRFFPIKVCPLNLVMRNQAKNISVVLPSSPTQNLRQIGPRVHEGLMIKYSLYGGTLRTPIQVEDWGRTLRTHIADAH